MVNCRIERLLCSPISLNIMCCNRTPLNHILKGEHKKGNKINAHPGNRTLVSTVGGYYDTTTPDALDAKVVKW